MTLCLCMIARNEQAGLTRSLESVKNLVNEIVIAVDHTSDDDTWKVAEDWLKEWDPSGKRYTLTEGLSVEEVGFAKARNHAIERVKSEWVLILDADEVFPEQATIKKPDHTHQWKDRQYRSHQCLLSILSSIDDKTDMMTAGMIMLDNEDIFQSHFQGERIFKKHIRFKYPMHNYIANASRGAMGPEDLAILHTRKHRPEKERQIRAEQRVRMAEKFFIPPYVDEDVAENPTRGKFYLAGTYNDAGRYEDAIKWFKEYLDDSSNWPEERYQAAVFLCRATLSMEHPDQKERREALKEARGIAFHYIADNWKRAELYCILGDISMELEEWEEAAWHYLQAAQRPIRLDPHFSEGITHSWLPRIRLAQVYYAMGNNEEAEKWIAEARETGAPEENIDWIQRTAMAQYPPIKKLAVFVDRGDNKFVQGLIDLWGKRYQVAVCNKLEAVEETMAWNPDAAWFEWAGPMLIKASQMPRQCRMIVRVHGYEVHSPNPFKPDEPMLRGTDWKKVDNVIFVANYLREMAMEQTPDIREHCSIHVVPGGVDIENWTVAEGKHGNRICMAGYVNHKKNIPLALEILHEARKDRPDLELHIAGERQDSREWQYIQQLIDELALRHCVFFHPWQENLNAWYADKDYYLSTSREESFHYALAQAMAAGLQPLIHCWRSARDFYPDKYIFRTSGEAWEMLVEQEEPDAESRAEYRGYIAEHLTFDHMVRDIDIILSRPTVSIPAPDTAPWRFERSVGEAMDAIGYAPAMPQNADVLIACRGGMDTLNLPSRNGQVRILWNAEHIAGNSRHAKKRRKELLTFTDKADHVVVSSPNMAIPLREAGVENVHVIFQGGAKGPWVPNPGKPKNIEVLFYGTMNPRRKRMIQQISKKLAARGRKAVQIIQSFDHTVLADFLHRSKIALNIHITDTPNVETRLAEAMSAGTFIVTERLPEGHEFESIHAEFDTVDEAVDLIEQHLAEDEKREALAKAGSDWIWQHMTVGMQVEKLLETCGRRWPLKEG